jgi:hypothetical protein
VTAASAAVATWAGDVCGWRGRLRFARATFEIEQVGDTVKLTVTHEMDRDDSKLIDGVSNGWPAILSKPGRRWR